MGLEVWEVINLQKQIYKTDRFLPEANHLAWIRGVWSFNLYSDALGFRLWQRGEVSRRSILWITQVQLCNSATRRVTIESQD